MRQINASEAFEIFKSGPQKIYKDKRFDFLENKDRTEEEEREYAYFMVNDTRYVVAVEVKEDIVINFPYYQIALNNGDFIVTSEEHKDSQKNNIPMVFVSKETFKKTYQ